MDVPLQWDVNTELDLVKQIPPDNLRSGSLSPLPESGTLALATVFLSPAIYDTLLSSKVDIPPGERTSEPWPPPLKRGKVAGL